MGGKGGCVERLDGGVVGWKGWLDGGVVGWVVGERAVVRQRGGLMEGVVGQRGGWTGVV